MKSLVPIKAFQSDLGSPESSGHVTFSCGSCDCSVTTWWLLLQEVPMQPDFKVRRATGIPQSFLTPLTMQAGGIPGAMMTHTGQLAVPTLDA